MNNIIMFFLYLKGKQNLFVPSNHPFRQCCQLSCAVHVLNMKSSFIYKFSFRNLQSDSIPSESNTAAAVQNVCELPMDRDTPTVSTSSCSGNFVLNTSMK